MLLISQNNGDDMKFFRALIKIISVILVISLTLTAIFFRKNGVDIVSIKSDDDIRAESICANAKDKQYKKITESGYLQLYFNEETTGIYIKETTGNKKWYSLPNGSESAMVSMTVVASDGNHILNSQSNSVVFSTFSYTEKENGVTVKYILADDKATAEKDKYSKNDVAFSVVLDCFLKDGNFFVESEINNLNKDLKCAVKDFSVLEYFGAFEEPKENDFLLIADGCGATALPYYENGEKEYSCKVYGSDYSLQNEETNHALMGTFGIKRNDSAYAAIINSSEEFASIKAVSSNKGFSRVAAYFSFDYVTKKDNSLYIYNNDNQKTSICYKFLSKGNATYSDIASACREQLIRNGTFSTSSIENSNDVPMTLVFTGACKENRRKLSYFNYTTFSQAEDIIKRVKAKGINNITIRYSDVYESNSSNIISGLGGKSGLSDLSTYAKSQNVSLYLDLNVLTYESFLEKADFWAARGMNKIPYSISKTNNISGYSVKYYFRSLNSADNYIDKIIKNSSEFGVTGFCIADEGNILSSDFSGSGAKRTEYKENIVSHISALSGTGSIMTDTGNVYTVKGSALINNIPMNVSYEESNSYKKIPFVQSVLHGISILSSEPLNLEENQSESVLRCIEYGVCPTFSVVYNKPDGCKSKITFDENINDIMLTYTDIADALDSLEGERITSHSQVKSGVFCTTYSNSVRIYVNYNKNDVSVSGVTVPAESYIRID